MELQVQISDEVMQRLLVLGVLHPSEIKCLNAESRDVIKTLCLAFCAPKNCHLCDMRDKCCVPVNSEQTMDISINTEKMLGRLSIS